MYGKNDCRSGAWLAHRADLCPRDKREFRLDGGGFLAVYWPTGGPRGRTQGFVAVRGCVRRGLALATMMAGVGAGAIGIPPLATWLIETYGWRHAYLLFGGSAFRSGDAPCGIVAAGNSTRREPGESAEISGEWRNAGRRSNARPFFWLLLIGFFLVQASLSQV
jgi:hypothetical protein